MLNQRSRTIRSDIKQRIYDGDLNLYNSGSRITSSHEAVTSISGVGTEETDRKDECEVEDSNIKLDLIRNSWSPRNKLESTSISHSH